MTGVDVTGGDRPVSQLRRRRLLGLAALSALPVFGCAKPGGLATLPANDHAESPPSGSTASGSTASGPTASGSTLSESTRSAAPVLPKGGGPVPFQPGKVMLGAYLDLSDLSLGESLALRRRQLGRDLRILHTFYAWTDTLPRSVPEMPESATLMVSWRGTYYDEINDGHWDNAIATAARRLARHGRPTLLRWGWEMNGDWYKWSGDSNGRRSAAYVKAWRRLHRIFGDQGCDNVSWVWSPNWNSRPDASWNEYADYYPGDRYVDWVGVSGYNFGKETAQTLFDPIYGAYGADKPIMITEVAAIDRGGRTKADWITRFAVWVKDHPAVGGVVWFDTDTHKGSSERFRIDSDTESLAAYRAMARMPLFRG